MVHRIIITPPSKELLSQRIRGNTVGHRQKIRGLRVACAWLRSRGSEARTPKAVHPSSVPLPCRDCTVNTGGPAVSLLCRGKRSSSNVFSLIYSIEWTGIHRLESIASFRPLLLPDGLCVRFAASFFFSKIVRSSCRIVPFVPIISSLASSSSSSSVSIDEYNTRYYYYINTAMKHERIPSISSSSMGISRIRVECCVLVEEWCCYVVLCTKYWYVHQYVVMFGTVSW